MDTTSLKSALNTCKPPTYTKLSELRPCTPYRVACFDEVSTRFGETVAVTLEGLVGDDYYLRVYLPKRYKAVLTENVIEQYNRGEGDRMHIVVDGARNVEFV